VTSLAIAAKASQNLHPYIPQILMLTLTKLKDCKTTVLRTRILESVMACLYYNPALTLSVVCHDDATVAPALFGLLFDSLKSMERDFSQRLVVLSFSAVLLVPPNELPEVLRGNFQVMFLQIVRELVLIEEETTRQENEEDDEGDDEDCDFGGMGDDDDEDGIEVDDDEDDDDEDATGKNRKKAASRRAKALYVPDGGYDEEDDCLNAEDEAYRAALESMDKEQITKSKRYANGELQGGDDEDEEDDDMSMEEIEFISPIENMNITQHFLDTMQTLQQRDGGALAASLRASLSAEDQERLEDLIKASHARTVAAAAAAAVNTASS
jgi:hypothetical protein